MIRFEDKRVFLIGGPGGVGKTTVAAALGMQLARKGYRTLVLTVDPAKRLAQALGIDGFGNQVQEVKLTDTKGTLFATMLDSEHYFDRVIERFAGSTTQRDKILNNRLYRVMVESLGGSHEYAAMERLLEFAEDAKFDKIVVDTPPTQNALDLLSAPERLAQFMDNSVLKWFRKRGGFSLLQQGTKLAMKALQKIVGGEFLESLSEVLSDLEGMELGFQKRNEEVMALLKAPQTSFLLVTQAAEARFLESVEFQKALESKQIGLSGVILNRTLPEPAQGTSEDPELARLLAFYGELQRNQSDWAKRFESTMKLPLLKLPDSGTPVHDMQGLLAVGQSLLD